MFESVQELIKAHEGVRREVYLDLENASPIPTEIVRAMIPYFSKQAYGNPTVTHKLGWMAYETIQKASERIADCIGASSSEEVNFTPGGTEANNVALIGTALANRDNGSKIVISEIEPLNIIFPSRRLEKDGFEVEKIPVDRDGFVDLEKLADAVDKDTVLVSIMMVNHEIGTVEPIKEAVEIVKEENPGALFHTDVSDAYGRISLSAKRLGVDLMTLGSYKILGPRGVGVLFIRDGVDVDRLLEGQIGTQTIWPGVENVPLIMGFAKASELAIEKFDENVSHMEKLRDRLMDGILEGIPETLLNGPIGEKRAPDNVNISFVNCEGESLTIELSLKGVYVSSGSACTRLILQPSHVLTAIGRRHEEAHGSILMKVTRYHTDGDLAYVLKVFPEAVTRIRDMNPIKRGTE